MRTVAPRAVARWLAAVAFSGFAVLAAVIPVAADTGPEQAAGMKCVFDEADMQALVSVVHPLALFSMDALTVDQKDALKGAVPTLAELVGCAVPLMSQRDALATHLEQTKAVVTEEASAKEECRAQLKTLRNNFTEVSVRATECERSALATLDPETQAVENLRKVASLERQVEELRKQLGQAHEELEQLRAQCGSAEDCTTRLADCSSRLVEKGKEVSDWKLKYEQQAVNCVDDAPTGTPIRMVLFFAVLAVAVLLMACCRWGCRFLSKPHAE